MSNFKNQDLSPQDSFHNESQEPTDFLECSKCGQSVEQILALQCDHNLCLECAGKIVSKLAKQYDLTQNTPPLRCEICSLNTMIDPSAMNILRDLNQSVHETRRSNWKSQDSKHQSPFKQEMQYDNLSQQSPDNRMLASLQYMENPMISNQFDQRTIQDTKQSIEPMNKYDRQYETGSSFKQMPQSLIIQNQGNQHINHQNQMTTCVQHISEMAVLYCFTCQTQCFCMECYLSGLHRNHDVKNAQKAFFQLKSSKVDQMWNKIKTSQETLLNDQCTVTNKKMELVEMVAQAKMYIKSNFEELYLTIQKKEKELLQAADEMIQDKLMEFDNEVAKIKQQFEVLNNYQQKISDYFQPYEYEAPSIQHAVQAFNYTSANNKKIDQTLEMISNSRNNQHPILQLTYTLDPNSVAQQVEDIRQLRIVVSSLRGVDTNIPTQREKYFFDKAKEGRGKRLFQNMNEQEGKSDFKNKFDLARNELGKNFDPLLESDSKREDEYKENQSQLLINKNLFKYSNQKQAYKVETTEPMSFEQKFSEVKRKLCQKQ